MVSCLPTELVREVCTQVSEVEFAWSPRLLFVFLVSILRVFACRDAACIAAYRGFLVYERAPLPPLLPPTTFFSESFSEKLDVLFFQQRPTQDVCCL